MAQNFLIVDDHPMFAEALQTAIRSALPAIEFEHACSIYEAKNAYEKSTFDLVMLDLWLPDNHGLSGIIELRRQCPRTPIIVISAFEDHNVIHQSMACGASGFIPKSEKRNSILRSISCVLDGGIALPECYFPPKDVSENELQTAIRRLNCLTPQELRVLQLLCEGLLNKQIAFELHVGESTVKAHVSKILLKLNVASRTQAVIEAGKFCLSPIPAFYTGGCYSIAA
ncbi:MAG: response regulator transcription factor [Hyphomicrobiaceae bacterium]